jgi:formylglycine-generating enzyme required for sulfatase activity
MGAGEARKLLAEAEQHLLPKCFVSSVIRRVKILTPDGERWTEIRYYKDALGMEFVRIPAGEFKMGSAQTAAVVVRLADANPELYKSERPQHKVRITKPFYIQRTELTRAEYEAVMGKGTQKAGIKDLPASLSWDGFDALCKKLGKRTGVTYRLPTEAEWEYACRAGTTTPFYTGATINSSQANFDGRYVYGSGVKGIYRQKKMAPGKFPANPWGLYDMHGNVGEWCWDWFGQYHANAIVDPRGPQAGTRRTMRGGSFFDDPGNCRSAYRASWPPDRRYGMITRGGRLVIVP